MDPVVATLRLVLIGLLPPLAAIGFYFLERKTKFGQWKQIYKQLIAGVVFGGIAVLATEFGAIFNGAVLNVRDAAAVTAGLLYGLPGGVVAGLIGGVERYCSAYWNGTYYTQLACSISTFISGLSAGVLRQYVFRTKRPNLGQGILVGLITETFHMLMIFLTNVTDPVVAFTYVRALGNKMITANMASTAVAMGALELLDYLYRDKSVAKTKRKRGMRAVVATNLSVIALIAIGVSGTLTYGLQSSTAHLQSISLLTKNVQDAISDIEDTSDNSILGMARNAASTLEDYGSAPDDVYLLDMLPASGVSEIHYINTEGIVAASTVPESRGYDMHSGDQQAAAFLTLLDDPGVYVQPFMPTSQDPTVKKKYAAVSLSFGGFVQVGFDAEKFYLSITEIVTQVVKNRHIGGSGYMLVCDDNEIIYSRDEKLDGHPLSELGFPKNILTLQPMTRHQGMIQDADSFYMFQSAEGFIVIGVVDVEEVLLTRNLGTFIGVYMEILIFGLLFIAVYALIDRLVLRDLSEANDQLAKITAGDLDQKLTVHHSREIAELNDSINATVDSLKDHIALEASRYDEELAFGKQLQLNSLPSKRAYLFRHDFSVFGNMVTAKQVGGDFYDYFMLTDKRIAFLIADVSGKGIPAAMFMMKTKSIIKSLAENGLPIADIVQRANERICEGNETETFVTTWLGICDLQTGEVEYVNAGHNPPMLLTHGKYTRLEMKRDLVLGAMTGVPYRKQTLHLNPGDMLFLYTDGITEAEAGENQFYGENRLLDFLNSNIGCRDPFTICGLVENDVRVFANGHEQTDDMTMVAFAYLGVPRQKHFEFPSTRQGVTTLCDEVTAELMAAEISAPHIDKIRLICEEVATNIAFHAYEGTQGIGKLDLCLNATQIVLTFADNGPKFNPLEKKDPDITLKAEDRQIGGLGIYMVKKSSDKIFYTYQERQNVLLIIINRG